MATTTTAAVRAYYSDLAERFGRKAATLEIPSTQNFTPKRGREWAVRAHTAANLRRAQRAALALADAGNHPAATRKLTMAAIEAFTRTSGGSNGYYSYFDTGEPAETSAQAVAFRAAIDAIAGDAREAEARRRREAELSQKLTSLRSCDIPGFFPTPEPLARELIAEAQIEPGQSVLEPSAGIGSLADLVREAGAGVECVEQFYAAAEILKLKGHNVRAVDFLAMTPEPRFDRVVMNPPFERGLAEKHVAHAARFLRPGGRLVAIVPATVKDLAFGEVGEVIRDAFARADAFRRTGVAVRILTHDAPAVRSVDRLCVNDVPAVELSRQLGLFLRGDDGEHLEIGTRVGQATLW